MIIYGANVSPFVRKVLAVAGLKGIEFEHKPVLPGHGDAEFQHASPLGKIPALVDGDLHVSDSSVICEYLEEKFPEVATLPADVAQRARARWYEEYGDSKLVEAMAPFFFERFAKRAFGDTSPPDEARLERVAGELCPAVLGYLEVEVPDEGFLFGELPMTADIALASPTVNARYGGYEIDAGQYPKTTAYRDRVLALPVMVELLEAEKAMMEALAG